MAQHGGSPREVITLAQPRPGVARRLNEYIDTPLRPPPPFPGRGSLKPGIGDGVPVTSQPAVATFKKEKLPEPASDGSDTLEDTHDDSIICKRCGRCRCDACQTPRPLPSRWICNDKFLCSAQNLVDYCSCVCCVKGLFYHWAKDYDLDTDVSCADKPCSCAPHRRCARWSCLGMLSLVLPCLCLYWPLRGCVKGCELCYGHFAGQGCRCSTRTPDQTSAKRLLESARDC